MIPRDVTRPASERRTLLVVLVAAAALLAASCATLAERTRFRATPGAPAGTVPEPVASRWRALGEPGAGGRITDVAFDPADPQRLLVAGDLIGAGLSLDGGETWLATFGLTNGELSRFTFHPTHPGEVWLATMGGPFVSLDGGRNWAPRRAGLPPTRAIGYSAPIDEILIDPVVPDRLLAFGGSHRLWDAPGTTGFGTVWESVDGGEHWGAIATVADGANLVDAVWLADGAILVAALDEGIFRSDDGGRSWQDVSDGLPHRAVRALAAHPGEPGRVWAALDASSGTRRGTMPGGVWRSDDGGRRWNAASRGLDLSVPVTGDPGRVARYLVVRVAPSDADVLLTANLAFGAEAVYRSSDGGDSWQTVAGAGVISRPPTAYSTPVTAEAAAFHPVDPARALIGNAEFVLMTTDGGQRWQDLTSDTHPDGSTSGRGFSGLVATRIEFSPDGKALLLCGMDGANPLLRDPRLARGWLRPTVGSDPWGGCADAAASAVSPGRWYVLLGQAGIFGGVAVIEADRSMTLLAGDGHGLPERYAQLGGSSALEVVRQPDGTESVLVALDGALLRSDDARTFRALPVADTVTDLEANPGGAGRIYLATHSGVLVSDDAGTTSRPLPGAPPGAVRLRSDPTGRALYAVVWRTDGAGLWRFDGDAFEQLLALGSSYDVAVDPADPKHLLLATNDHPFHDEIVSVGVLRSGDGGRTWEAFNSGLPLLRVAAVAFDPSKSGRAVLGTFGRGFFEGNDLS